MPAQRLYDWFMLPCRVAAVRRGVPRTGARILDVGCGNHSPRTFRRYLPACVYHGLDSGRWNRDADDDRLMDRFFPVDLDRPDELRQVPDGAYDAVVCSHVLEHLAAPYDVVPRLAAKLAAGGLLYIEGPSARSLTLPRAHDGWHGVRGCLNFRDDETHREWVDLRRVAAELREAGWVVSGPRPARLWRRVLLLPLYIVAVLAVKGFIPAGLLWDVTGFADALVARRNAAKGVGCA